jgi:hypothetical protein
MVFPKSTTFYIYFCIVYCRWTPAWGDTVLVLGGWLGQQLGNWTNFQVRGALKGQKPPDF